MKSETSSPSSSASRSRNSSFRKKTPRPIPSNQDAAPKGDTEADSRSDQGRLKLLIENLDIRFVDCTLTYKESHFDAQQSASVARKRTKLASLRSRISNSIGKLREAISCEKTFNNCLFVPIEEKDKVKDFVRTNFSDVKLSFEGCKFIKRSSSLPEKLVRKLRNFFGIEFELEYINATATINHYTFRVKDIISVNQHIQQRIVEEA